MEEIRDGRIYADISKKDMSEEELAYLSTMMEKMAKEAPAIKESEKKDEPTVH